MIQPYAQVQHDVLEARVSNGLKHLGPHQSAIDPLNVAIGYRVEGKAISLKLKGALESCSIHM